MARRAWTRDEVPKIQNLQAVQSDVSIYHRLGNRATSQESHGAESTEALRGIGDRLTNLEIQMTGMETRITGMETRIISIDARLVSLLSATN